MNSTIDLSSILFQIIKGLPWWFWAIIIVGFIFGGSKKSKSRRNYYKKDNRAPTDITADKIIDSIIGLFKPQKDNSNIDQMSGRDFEKYLETIFIKLGYSVNRVGTCWYDHRGDFGADLIVQRDGIKTAIQAKCHSNFVGINSIREVLGAFDYYNCQKAIVITNNYFTNDAQIQARASNVELWNRDKLTSVISELNDRLR